MERVGRSGRGHKRPSASSLARVDPDAPDVANLWRVHWFNDPDRKSRLDVPMHVVLPPEVTGVKAPITVLIGCNFPMIRAHKVLAAYACLVPRLITGSFDPSHQRAIWPSTGNYCRGGVAISRILGCRGVAVLPAGMSRERFDWLSQKRVAHPSDIIGRPAPRATLRKSTTNAPNSSATRQRHFQPVLGVLELSDSLHLHRPSGTAFSTIKAVIQELPARRLRVGDGVGRHDCGRRPAEEDSTAADRRRRGGRMSDHAVQRLWRAQHPGHRRQ